MMRSFLAAVCLTGILFSPLVAQESDLDIGQYLQEIQSMSEAALAASQAAAEASSVDEIRAKADEIFTLVWGSPSGLVEESSHGAAAIHGWKVRWQSNNDDFDEAFAERYGTEPPAVTDPQELGIMGRGRAVRRALQALLDTEGTPAEQKQQAEAVVASLNNVIGWMKMNDGVTKGERQPRVDLTRKWDAPSTFWLSTSDTGWLPELFSQAVNILKVDYEGDLDEAREHAAGLVPLAERVLNGLDANEDGTVEAIMMEGGLNAMIAQAQAAGLLGS